jgi:hypothetical protein
MLGVMADRSPFVSRTAAAVKYIVRQGSDCRTWAQSRLGEDAIARVPLPLLAF